MFIQNKSMSITPPPARAPVIGTDCSFLGCIVSWELPVNGVLAKQELPAQQPLLEPGPGHLAEMEPYPCR